MFGAGFGAQQPAFGAAQPATGAFGQTSFGAFGQQPQQQQQQPAFGATPTQGFGAAAPAFGASPAPAFGAAPAPAFGAAPAAAPAFGAPATNAFGTPGAFGAPRPATGAFGAFGGTTNAFGAASQPAFGSSLGTSTFGAASTPAFGSTSTPGAFGAPATNAFGSTSQAPSPFGAPAATQSTFGMPSSTGLFGAAAAPAATTFGAPAASPGFGAAGGFGAASPGATGTRIAPYQKTVERDGTSATGAASTANYITITAMPQYQNKSLEELRWEDYQAGIKTAASAPAPASAFGAASPGGFGATTTGFGTPSPASTSAFGLGTTGAFGTTAPATGFGSTPATNAFGGGGLFGGQSAAAPTFGSTAPTFGAASATNPFGGGAASTSTFGAPAATSAFGAANPFGSTPAPTFGAASTAPRPAAFSFNTPGSTFGAASTPATGFGATTPSLFGASPAPAGGGLFGSTAPNAFGQTTATPATAANPFGQSAFGAKPAGSAFGSQPSAFGASSTGAFGTNMFGQPGAGGSLFGPSAFPAASSPAPSMFGNTTPSLFGGGGTTGSLFGGGQFGGLGGGSAMQPFQSAAAAQPAAPLNVAVAPYGAFPSLPSVPEPKVGISSRPARTASGGGYGALSGRASPLVSLRATASGVHNKMGAVTGTTSRGVSASPLGSLGVVAGDSGSGAMSLGTTPNGALTGTPGLLRPRPNPHQLFIREPPPSTHNAPISSAFSPARTPTETQRDTSPQHEGRNGSTANGGGSGVPYNPFPPASPPTREAARDTAADTAAADGGTAARKTSTASTRNGAGPSSNGADGAAPSYSRRAREVEAEEEDSSYLPQLGRLSHDDYTYEPSSRQLVAMHQSDPESLSHVSNFTVERKGVGSVRWLNPVDVRGLKLEDIVSIQHGEVACFTQGVKPPEGTGLNSEALITLWEVYKTDKEGNVIKDGPAIIKWEKQLRSMCGKMGSKFVSYKAAGGVWKFEVEHFSRYGLLADADDDDEEEEEEEEEEEAPQRLNNGVSDALAVREVVNLAEDERRGERANGAGASTLAGSLRQGSGPSGRMGMHRPGAKAQPSTPSAPLQHALPTHLALSSQKLRTMQDTFFTVEPEPAVQLRPSTDLVPAGGFTPAAGPSCALVPAPIASSTPTQGGNLFPQVWRTPTPALRASRRPTIASAGGMSDASMALATPSSSHVLSPPDGRAGAAAEGMSSHHHMDAGLSLGLSFRPSWGPNGTLVIPGPPGLRMGSGAQPIMVRRVLVEGQGSGYGSDAGGDTMDETEGPGMPPRLAALRAKLRALLQVHLRHSAPVGDGDDVEANGSGARDDFLPQWRLQCSPQDLPGLVAQLVASAQSPGAELAAAGAALSPEEESAVALLAGDEDWQADVQHEVETWRLLKVLFEAEPPGAARTTGSGGDSGRSASLLEEDAMETGAEMARSDITSTGPAPPLSAALHRQSGFSRWLQQQVLPDVHAALQRHSGGPTSSCDAILELLSARHVAGAAAVAAAAGDVRLATLVACAGQRAAAQAQARQQLDIWQTTGMTGRIAPDRLLVYKLLAGQVSEVIPHLGLDWRRALGLYVWYLAVPGSPAPAAGMASMGYETPGQPTGSSSSGVVPAARNQPGALAAAASLYHQALQQHQPLPAPLPPHCRDLLPSSVPQNPPADLQYTLLQLWVQREQLAAQALDDAMDQPPLGLQTPPQLLAPASHSSNPCATALPWALLTVLQSVDVLEHVADQQLVVGAGGDTDVLEPWELTLDAHMALVSQLLLAGELCEWAVYVALHLPDRPSVAGATAGRLRQAVVQQLLELTAPQWVGHDSREAFFTDVLGIPQVLLSDAAAGWALARGDTAGAVQQYLAAEQWQAAHGLLAMQLAPLLVCQERVMELRELLVALEPHASSCTSWQYGGGMYLAYLEAVHASRTTSPHASSLAELQDLAAALCQAKDGAAAALSSNAELMVVEPGAQAAGGGVDGVLTLLAALELMSRRVQGLLMRALASELASGMAECGALDLPLMLSSFAGQASTRSTSIGAAVSTLAAQLLAV